MSNSVQPHRQQPTRLLHPWDSPGKNTGVGCHFLLQCRKVKSESEVAQSCPTLGGLQPTRLLRPWDFPGKSTGVGCHCLLHFRSLDAPKVVSYEKRADSVQFITTSDPFLLRRKYRHIWSPVTSVNLKKNTQHKSCVFKFCSGSSNVSVFSPQ